MAEAKRSAGGIDERVIEQRYSVTVLFCPNLTRVVVQQKTRGPYNGCLNFPGGKTNKGEDFMEAAYRELTEETGIGRDDIVDLEWLTTETFPGNKPGKYIALDVFGTVLKSGRTMDKLMKKNDVGESQWWEPKSSLRSVTNPILAGEGNVAYLVNLAELRLRAKLGLKPPDPGYVGTL